MIINLDENSSFSSNILSIEEIKKEIAINPFAKYLGYEENGMIIGYLYYSDIYDRAEVNQIEIEKIHRNCGKASKLLQKMIETVEKNITLEVRVDNYPALALYKKFNFQEVAIRNGYYNGIDGILMERKNQ